MEKVFVYGTLRDRKLRKKLSGREIPQAFKDKLTGFDLSSVIEEGNTYPIIIENKFSEQVIEGEVIELTEAELQIFDQYEGPFYRRIKIKLESNFYAWAYIQ